MSGAVCIAHWHVEAVDHNGLQYAFSPCATFDTKHPIGGWVLMEIFDHAQRWAVWEQFSGQPPPKVPKAVTKALLARVKKVKKIEPCPYED